VCPWHGHVLTDSSLIYTMGPSRLAMGCTKRGFQETMGSSSEPTAWYQDVSQHSLDTGKASCDS
jgi:hypothetical protein